ncbi:head-tail joining protein [Acetobacter oryzifermentans]|uniref:head-tail joining protein n=1 Tax=Acetobacter oryzifermentans TaxID=1633874 RepID=UPI0007B05297|nr:hypothetical protein [Acetobacter oryzifermentans]
MVGPVDWDNLVLDPCQNAFGEEVQWISSLYPDPISVTGIFDNGYKAMPLEIVDGLSPTHVTTADARLGVQISQFVSEPQQGDIFLIRGKQYRVREVQPDSHGAADILLNKADGENALSGHVPRKNSGITPDDY